MLHSDIDGLVPGTAFDRRRFMQAALGGAFAASVLPVSAQTITTDSVGLEAGTVRVPSGSDMIPAYRAQPAGATHLPVMLVIHEIFGVHAHIADICRRFAKLGYLAIAPDLYAREGDASTYPTMQALQTELVSKVPDAQVSADLDATVAWAGAHGGDLDRLGVSGYCWGGRQAWLYAEHNPRLRAVVAWYGRVAGDTNAMTPFNPIDQAAQLKAPVLALYGAKDGSIPQATLTEMRGRLLASGTPAGRDSQLLVYPDAGHAFFADYRPSYVKADAEDSWQRALAWFRQYGVN